MKLIVGIACHKPYRVIDGEMYLPLQVGALNKPSLGGNFQRDDDGLSISEKNTTFCELTGLYWLWKNRSVDAAGLCHYRRYFEGKKVGDKWARILQKERAQFLLSRYDAILPKKRHYWIETNYSQYVHAHHEKDLLLTRQILQDHYGEVFVQAFDRVMGRTSGHRFNMFIMKEKLLDDYCTFLFDVLFELERRLDICDYSDYDRRVFGFVGERLLDVYLEAKHFSYKELPVISMESQHWPTKIRNFLLRKLKGNRV